MNSKLKGPEACMCLQCNEAKVFGSMVSKEVGVEDEVRKVAGSNHPGPWQTFELCDGNPLNVFKKRNDMG